MTEEENEIMLDLLCKQAVYGLTEEETRQLAQFETGDYDPVSFEMTAAQIGLLDLKSEQMPDHLLAKITTDADEYWVNNNSVETVERESPRREVQMAETKVRGSFMDWFGWAVAAAACIALAVNIYSTRNRPGEIVTKGPTPPSTQLEKLDPQQQRLQLMNSPEVVKADFGKGNVKEIAEVSGDVVWSPEKQAGYLRLNGLPKNDAAKQTYQLWIFDESQSEKTPIDGGTFDINSDGEVIIPIDARLRAHKPAAFAVTIEKAGGVVVSDRGKIAALAAVKPNQS
ncbi:MAG: anti-sigma factor [Pyrinomonadaceae bacterium]